MRNPLSVVLAVLLGYLCCRNAYCSSRATLLNNGYDEVVIAINPSVPEDEALLESLKEMVIASSRSLFEATKHRAFFRSVKILVPESWTNGTYSPATQGESYSLADMIVAEPNPSFGHIPYALQYGTCGQPGQYIHVTPEYVKYSEYTDDTGERSKVMVHEWAHLRWGVFDEGPTAGYPEFYLDGNNRATGTRCPATIAGENILVDYETGNFTVCEIDSTTLLPVAGCVFTPYITQPADGISSSIMSYQYVENIVSFCHSNDSDPVNLHNQYAPNEQNRLCNQRSTWDVILESADFRHDNNPANESIIDTTPTISVVQTLPTRFVLVMDVSGSMATNDRITVMQRAAGLFVTDFASDASQVGLVSFTTTAKRLSELRTLDDNVRNELRGIIDSTAPDSYTAIGQGIQEGLEVLKGPNQEYAGGGHIIVLTDGEENRSPWVEDVYDNVTASGARLCTVFLDLTSSSANQIMTDLSIESGCSWFVASSSTQSNEILSNFLLLSQSGDGNDVDETVQIHTASISLTGFGAQVTGSVQIDSTIGEHTLFFFTWTSNQPDIIVSSPTGCEFTNIGSSLNACPDQPIHECDATQRSCKFTIPGTATTGQWTYSVTSTASATEDGTVTVTSRPRNDSVSVLTVESYIAATNITTAEPALIYAKVSNGFDPVLGANVTAVITDTSSNTEIYLQLLDNGAGADIRTDDGIYSRYFYQYSSQGRYSVRILVSGSLSITGHSAGSPAAFNPGTLYPNGTFIPNPNGLSNIPNVGVTNTASNGTGDEFNRVTSGGSFSYTGPTITSGMDVFGPNPITDLSATQINASVAQNSSFIQVYFSAPGDDLDVGTTSYYAIRYTNESSSLLLNDFDSGTAVNQQDVVTGNLSSPQEALSGEIFVIEISHMGENDTQIFLAITAFDEVGHSSGVSNIASVTVVIARISDPVTESTQTPTNLVVNDQPPDDKTAAIIIGVSVGGAVVILSALLYVVLKLYSPSTPSNKVEDFRDSEAQRTSVGMTPVMT